MGFGVEGWGFIGLGCEGVHEGHVHQHVEGYLGFAFGVWSLGHRSRVLELFFFKAIGCAIVDRTAFECGVGGSRKGREG